HHREDHFALRRRRVDVLLIGDEVDPQVLKLLQGVDQRLGRARKPIIPPDEHHIDVALPRRLHQPPILRAIVLESTGIVNVLPDNQNPPPHHILPEPHSLGLWRLALIKGGDPGIECHPLLRYHSPPLQQSQRNSFVTTL